MEHLTAFAEAHPWWTLVYLTVVSNWAFVVLSVRRRGKGE
jgi:hypothetical protein